MWKKSLIAAAVASVSLPGHAAEPAANTAPRPDTPPPDERDPNTAKRLGAIQVEGAPDEAGLKAESQASSSKMDLTLRETPQSVTVITQEPLPGWQVSAAYNGLDSDFEDPDDPFFGAKPPGSARWQVGAFTSYETSKARIARAPTRNSTHPRRRS